MNDNKLNEEMFECKMYITDLETDRKSKEIDIKDLVFDDYIEFEFGDYENEDYLQLPYKDFKFFINDYSVTFYSPQYHKLKSNWNSLRKYAKDEFKKYPDGFITSIVEKYNDCFTSDYTDFDKHSIILNILKEKDKVILDKMNELEGNTYEEN